MKRIVFSALMILSFCSNKIFCEEETKNESESTSEINIQLEETSNSEFSEDYSEKFHLIFDEGIALACVTRIQQQEGRSNFVWNDSLIGAYFSVHINNFFSFDVLARTEVFYPFQHTFNGMIVYPKQTILYAFDEFVGIPFKLHKFSAFGINIVPGGHIMYQLSDEYHLFYFGGGAIVGAEFPISKKWTILLDGTFTCDYPNLGTNSLVQPFYIEWQWQTSLGVRYSKKVPNKYHYIKN